MASNYIKLPPDSGGGGGAVDSVNGLTGVVVLTKSNIGLGNVNNTSDANKPVSTAQQIAIDGKVEDTIVDGVTTIAPSQNAVFDALAGKQNTIDGNFGTNNILGTNPSTGNVEAIPGWNRTGVDAGNGLYQYLTVSPDDFNTGYSVGGTNLDVDPLQDSPNDVWNVLNHYINIDPNGNGFQFGTNGTALRVISNYVNHQQESDIGQIEFINNNLNIGNGTDPVDIRGFSYAYGFGQINANVNVSNAIQGYGFQPNVNASATISSTTYIQAFYDSTNIGCESPNYICFNASPTIDSIANNNNFTALNINPNIDNFNGDSGGNAINIGGDFGTFSTGGLSGLNINMTATNVNYAYGLNVSMDNVSIYPGVKSALVIQDLTIEFSQPGDNSAYQVEYLNTAIAGSETVSLAGQLITVNMESGVSTATQIKTAMEANFSLNSNLDITVSGVGSNPQNAQAATNFTGGVWPGNKKAAYLDGDVEITGALTFGGALSIGQLNAYYSTALIDGGGTPSSIHSLITAPTVAANVTIANADMLGVNTASLINIGANATVTTAFLGVSALGLPAVLTMGAGATVDRVAGAVFAISLDAGAGGGTVDTVALCRALALPNGVTTVNRLYGYEMSLPFGDPGTTSWGFYESPGVNNYFAGNLLIGGTAGSDDTVTNSSVALEIKSTTKGFMNARMTTTERNALTAVNGLQIYNSTDDKLQVYAGGSWVDLH